MEIHFKTQTKIILDTLVFAEIPSYTTNLINQFGMAQRLPVLFWHTHTPSLKWINMFRLS